MRHLRSGVTAGETALIKLGAIQELYICHASYAVMENGNGAELVNANMTAEKNVRQRIMKNQNRNRNPIRNRKMIVNA